MVSKRKRNSSSKPTPPKPPPPSQQTPPKSSETRSAHEKRALNSFLNPPDPTFRFDGRSSIEAGMLTHFNLAGTIEDAVQRARDEGHIMEPAEKDPRVFDFAHIAHALALSAKKPDSDSASSQGSEAPPPKKKNRKKRAKSDLAKQEEHRKLDLRGGKCRKGGAAEEKQAQLARQLERTVKKSEVFKQSGFSILEDASVASTGRCGRRMPQKELREWRNDYNTGQVNEAVAQFTPVHFTGKSTMIVDQEGRLFAYRTEQVNFLNHLDAEEEIKSIIDDVLGHVLSDPMAKKNRENGERGDHEPCIMGHMRQYLRAPALTKWHRSNEERVNRLLQKELMQRTTDFVERTLRVMFPGIAARYEQAKNWYEGLKYPLKMSPLFGLYWCLCINGIFQGQKRIHCIPHIDYKNIVGVCALLVYQLPGSNFDHTTMCWLVLWEAEVAIQLPPWTIFFYPSSLLHHFNKDVHDFEFVVTGASVKKPTKSNSQPLRPNDGSGRGSFVYFNQASVFSGPETGHMTLKEAEAAGVSRYRDYGEDAAAAFAAHCTTVTMPAL